MYPHVAQVHSLYTICGGSVISDRVVITAAHCLYTTDMETKLEAKELYVYLGSDVLDQGVKYSVCKVVTHERYQGQDEVNFYFYDIGLLLLSRKIRFGPTIKKVKIAGNSKFRNTKYSFTLAGFGAVTNVSPATASIKLKATRMYYVRTKTCNESQSFREVMTVPKHMFCLIGQGWTSDCFGDSGSGIIWKRYLVGLVSTGRDVACGSDTLPSMYTDVVYFRKWVKAKTLELESTPVEQCRSKQESEKFLKSKMELTDQVKIQRRQKEQKACSKSDKISTPLFERTKQY
ncbi:Transmembrane protease serine 11F [Papilio xuthus]|uniref:Transmembrane protease serine 11F n=1 Tax=Papilio xuthus TaxID=66420 RepID=A0A194PNU8_PAPXU|nr:Transmembrane protease serine 11F [Papilio xuthus]